MAESSKTTKANEAAKSVEGDVKDKLAWDADKDLHPAGAPEHAADATSVPGPEYPPADRPPVATPFPDHEIIKSLATGAGEHTPPDPAVFDEMGRVRSTDDEDAKS